MEDYTSEELAAWRKNFRVNSKLKTANKTVRNLYDVILESEYRDSDYWYSGGGADEVTGYLNWFDDRDMADLMGDLPGWTMLQQDILADCLVYGGRDWPHHRLSKTFEYQSDLLLHLFSVTGDLDIRMKIFEHADIILEAKPKPCDLLLRVKAWAAEVAAGQLYHPARVHCDLIDAALQKAGC